MPLMQKIENDRITAIRQETQRLEDNARDAQIAADANAQYEEDSFLTSDLWPHNKPFSVTSHLHLFLKLSRLLCSALMLQISKKLLIMKSMRYNDKTREKW